MTEPPQPPPNRRRGGSFFIGNQPTSYQASVRRSSAALSAAPSAFTFQQQQQQESTVAPPADPDPVSARNRRRASWDSWTTEDRETVTQTQMETSPVYPMLRASQGTTQPRPRSGSVGDLNSFNPPNPPFASSGRNSFRDSNGSDMSFTGSDSSSGNGVFRNSAAGNLTPSQSSPNVSGLNGSGYGYPVYMDPGVTYPQPQPSPTGSQINFKPAFQSPVSRRASNTNVGGWVPPRTPSVEGLAYGAGMGSNAGACENGSSTGVGLRAIDRRTSRTNIRPSTLLVRNVDSIPSLKKDAQGSPSSDAPVDSKDKPTLVYEPLPRTRTARYITLLCILLGIAGAGLLCFSGVKEVRSSLLNEKSLCLVLDEDWSSSSGGDLNGDRWQREVELGGFGNGEFQMTTTSPKNVYIKNGQLYILPTLTSDDVPDWDQDGKVYTLDGCTGAGAGSTTTTPTNNDNNGGNSTNGGTNSTTNGNANGSTTNTGNGNGNNNNVAGGGTTNNGGAGATNNANHNGNGNNNQRREWLLPRQQLPTGTRTLSASASSTASGSPSSSQSNSTSNPGIVSNPNTSGPSRDTNACVAKTDNSIGTVVNPVMSGRVSTKGKVGVKYGRVEVKAKIGRGDWLWPAIWMLPENNTYGAWPLSGEIDIMEARGNAPTYPAQGSNYVRSSLNYGLSKGLLPIAVQGGVQPEPLTKQLYGWFSSKRSSFDKDFHTYAVEWDEDFMRFYVDSRIKVTLQLKVTAKKGKNGKEDNYFWNRGKFPPTAQNATDGQVVVVQNPWENGGNNAPFDQKFYLVIDHAVGGTSGWFPDALGNKPWFDESQTAMRDFAKAQDEWYKTWPESEDDRALRIKSVKMWSQECS